MRYIIGILLITILMEPSVFACTRPYAEYEPPLEIVKGIGGECYYKLVPPLENYANRSYGQTEFYLNKEDTKPILTKKGRFLRNVLCTKDFVGNDVISYVDRNVFEADQSGIHEDGWLNFYVNDQIVKSYSPIEIIERSNNTVGFGTCGSLYLQEEKDFMLDSKGFNYIYQAITVDKRIVSFDPLTGEKLSTEIPLFTLLMDSVRNNDLKQVQDILSQEVDVNKGNTFEGTPLHLASNLGYIEIVEELLATGAELDWAGYDLQQSSSIVPHHPLYVAVANKHVEVVEILVSHGIDINTSTHTGSGVLDSFALEAATRNKDIELINYLLENGANIDDTQALQIAVFQLNHEVVNVFLQAGVNVKQYCTLCVIAGRRYDKSTEDSSVPKKITEIAQILWEAGATTNVKGYLEQTSLTLTIREQEGLLAKFLIEKGAEVDLTDYWGAPALYYASKQNNKDLVTLLLNEGANPNVVPNDINIEYQYLKSPALFVANDEIKQLLLNNRADINITSLAAGNNALQHLFEQGGFIRTIQRDSLSEENKEAYLKTIKILLDAGIDTTHKNNNGKTARDLLQEAEVKEANKDFVAEIKNMIMVSP